MTDGSNIARTNSMLLANAAAGMGDGHRPACVLPALQHNWVDRLNPAHQPVARIMLSQIVPGAGQLRGPTTNPQGILAKCADAIAKHMDGEMKDLADGVGAGAGAGAGDSGLQNAVMNGNSIQFSGDVSVDTPVAPPSTSLNAAAARSGQIEI